CTSFRCLEFGCLAKKVVSVFMVFAFIVKLSRFSCAASIYISDNMMKYIQNGRCATVVDFLFFYSKSDG
ncbi:hypothetical protein ACT7CZ_18515, partial [Bacillus cereus]